MKVKFLCMGATRNVSAPGQPPTYNVDYQVVPGDKAHDDVFGGQPFGVLSLRNLKKAPHGLEQSVTIDLAGSPATDRSATDEAISRTPGNVAQPGQAERFGRKS